MIEGLHKFLQSLMVRFLCEIPLHLSVFIPLVVFSDILSHEQKLLAGMTHHIAVTGLQVGKLFLSGSRHLAQHRRLSVHHLVMGKHQHEPLAVGINHAEGEHIVAAGTEVGVLSDIVQEIVHPAHVPLHVKAKAAFLLASRNQRPCGRFLRDGQGAAAPLMNHAVDML